MALSSDTIAIVIATLSAVGFTIVIAIPSLSSLFYQLLSRNTGDGLKLPELEPSYRIIERFSQPKWMSTYYLLSWWFIVPGILVVLQGLVGSQIALQVASLTIMLVGVGAFLVFNSYVVLRSTVFLPNEVRKKIIEYMASAKTQIAPSARRPKKVCPKCGCLCANSSKFCRNCGVQFP